MRIVTSLGPAPYQGLILHSQPCDRLALDADAWSLQRYGCIQPTQSFASPTPMYSVGAILLAARPADQAGGGDVIALRACP
jgi:hypothetical protein